MKSALFHFVIFAVLAALSQAFTVIPQTSSSAITTTTSHDRRLHHPPTTTVLSMAGPAVLEPPTKDAETIDKSKEDESTKAADKHKKGGWAVRLFNDPMNKREFVAMCLSQITGLTDGQAYQVMMGAHKNGVAVVGRYDQERAELYRDSLRDNGLTVDMVPVEDD